MPKLRDLQLLIEPKAKISNRCLRTAFVNFLTEFLFECNDMDSIPKSLSQVLDIVNKDSDSSMHNVSFQKKFLEQEVDCILNVSSQTKQIVLDLLPGDEFDQDFTDAYMEELVESDDSDIDEDENDIQLQEDRQFTNGTFSLIDSNYKAESIGDFVPFEFHPSTPMTEQNVSSCSLATCERFNGDSEKLQPMNCGTVNLESKFLDTPRDMITDQYKGESTEYFSLFTAGKNDNSSVTSPGRESSQNVVKRHDFYESNAEIDPGDATNLCPEETELMPPKYSACKNQYLATQDACDKPGMLAYKLIGHMLKEFAIVECLDLNLRKSSYVCGDNQIEDVKETKENSSSGKRTRCPAIVRVIQELIPSFPDRHCSSMERLKMLMGL